MPDIDIDFADRNLILEKIEYRIATIDETKKHNTGIYVTEIPHNVINNFATVNYKEAEERGYFKLDFLNVSIYKDVKDEEHLIRLMEKEPLWELLEHKEFVDLLFHLSGHSEICIKLKPKNIEQLAAVLAIIRPAKRYLLNEDWNTILSEVWMKPDDNKYYFKKAHAISYAVAITVHMNLICENLNGEN